MSRRLSGFTAGRFVFRSPAQQSALTFSVKSDKDGVHVEQAGIAPEVVRVGLLPAKPNPVAAEQLPTLEHLGTVELRDAPGPMRIYEFDFDAKGRCGYLRDLERGKGELEFVLIDTKAAEPMKSARSIGVKVPCGAKLTGPSAAWVGGDRWVIVEGTYENAAPTRAWILDTGTGVLKEVEKFTCPQPKSGNAVRSGGAHGFLVVTNWTTDEVVKFSSEGVQEWAVSTGGSLQDAAIREDGTVGALLGIQPQLVEYSAAGKETRRVDLTEAFPLAPNYVAGLEAGEKGEWIVHDFGAARCVVRFGGKEKAVAYSPHFPDGRTFRLAGDVRRAPDGKLWTSDGGALLRLDKAGQVDLVIGPKPDTNDIEEARAVAVDEHDQVYVLDGRTGKTHVFDAGGKTLRILTPEPTDFGTDVGPGSLTVDGTGAVYARPCSFGLAPCRYLRFDEKGARTGLQSSKTGDITEEWYFRPGGQEMLIVGYERSYLFDASGKQAALVERRADGLWMERFEDAAVAGDGGFAVVAWNGSIRSEAVTIFSAAGVAERDVEVANRSGIARVAIGKSLVAVMSGTTLQLVDRTTGKTKVFSVPGASDRSYFVPALPRDGNEVWLIDGEGVRVEKFALPRW